MKIKTVEALCNSKPLVTTSIGAEGIEEGNNKVFFVCDSPKEMVDRLSNLIKNQDLRNELSNNAYKFALQNFVPENAYKELIEVLKEPFLYRL